MPNTKDLRRRIKSVKNTSQITRAMQMVSATKMRKAQAQALSSRPYADLLSRALSLISSQGGQYSHYLLEEKDSESVGIVLFSTDKGLCGGLNTNLIRKIQSEELRIKNSGKKVVYYTVGKKGRDFLVRTEKNLKADFENPEHAHFVSAINIRKFLTLEFKSNLTGEVYLLYPDFISTLRQEPKLVKILPIDPDQIKEEINFVIASEQGARSNLSEITSSQTPRNDESGDFLFEPNVASLLDYALNHFLDIQIYKAYLETRASEHSARMIAMQNATDNAKELVTDLTLTYNQVRQENITRELLEITSAGAALE
ncbi:MAG: ATP synthase F1 subunit gamma [Candidatus Daviesbacteria bacterium]|nr:ATP synthase F1 subunit gamma [Candidatus Daviesbacteria bacterium]